MTGVVSVTKTDAKLGDAAVDNACGDVLRDASI